ncbi:MAG TPA: hypothetical protein VGF94_05145 [Kofleriaceae bacterium]|jgi:proteasome lid subunit RPN8/RPN11
MSSLDTRAIEEKELHEAPCPATRQDYRVYLAEAAFDRAVARGDGDTTREIGGVLVGELLRDAAGPYLRIDTTIDALHAEEKGAELTFTHATWDHIHKEMDGKHKDKRVVGWYHTHPGFGIFLSDRDQFIHKSFFNLPFQIALVYDPKSREHGVFTWHDNEVWRARRYFVGSREQLWDGPRAQENPERAAASAVDLKAVKAEPVREASDEPLFPASPGTLLVAAAVLMLLAGFVGHWLGASSGNAALVEAQGELDKARHEGEQFAIGQLNSDLVGVLRDTVGDQALHKPVGQAITAIDAAIASMEPKASGSGSAAGSGSGSGSAAGSASGSASGSGSAAGPGPGTGNVLAQLKQAREILARLGTDRSSAATALDVLERASKSESMLKADLAHDVAEQRAAIGIAYSELSANAMKAGDKDRAMRLLAAAAHLDPGNRARYEQQLQAIDPSASLPPGGTQ